MMICKLIQSNKHIPLHPLGGCNKYKKKNIRIESTNMNSNIIQVDDSKMVISLEVSLR